MRFLSGLLLGVIIGVGGTVYFLSAGGGDYIVATSPRVQRLETDLRRVTSEREQGVKKLEEATHLIDQMAIKFAELERRFQALESAGTPHTAPERKQDEPAASTIPTPESEASQEPPYDEAAKKAAPESPSTEGSESEQGAMREESQPGQPEEHPEGHQAETPDPSSQETAPPGATEAQPGGASESSGQEETLPETPESEQDKSVESPS